MTLSADIDEITRLRNEITSLLSTIDFSQLHNSKGHVVGKQLVDACRKGARDAVQLLLKDRHCNLCYPHSSDDIYEDTALHISLQFGNYDLVPLLLESGVSRHPDAWAFAVKYENLPLLDHLMNENWPWPKTDAACMVFIEQVHEHMSILDHWKYTFTDLQASSDFLFSILSDVGVNPKLVRWAFECGAQPSAPTPCEVVETEFESTKKTIYNTPFVKAYDIQFVDNPNVIYEFVLHGADVNDEIVHELYVNDELKEKKRKSLSFLITRLHSSHPVRMITLQALSDWLEFAGYYASELFDDEGVVEDILSYFPMEEDFLLEDDLPRNQSVSSWSFGLASELSDVLSDPETASPPPSPAPSEISGPPIRTSLTPQIVTLQSGEKSAPFQLILTSPH